MTIKTFFRRVKGHLYGLRLTKKYTKAALKLKDGVEKQSENLPKQHSEKIFVCWFQGIENAPDIVKICHKTLFKYNSDKEIIVITEDNYSQFVQFPQFILDKYKKGYISKTHFSDLLRLELLIKYGGCWVDSTAYFTAPIPEYILNSDLFLFQAFNEHTGKTTGISNWFINSCSNDKLLILERELLYLFWKNNNKLKDYFVFHHLFTGVVIKVFKEEWESVILSNLNTPKVLDCYLFKPFDKRLYDIVADSSFIHKFMYKYPEKEFEKKGTFYDSLKQEYLGS